MALDGITVSCLVHEWQQSLVGGRITKIAQPEPDELLLTIKNYDTYRLHLSASASLPLACLIPDNRSRWSSRNLSASSGSASSTSMRWATRVSST